MAQVVLTIFIAERALGQRSNTNTSINKSLMFHSVVMARNMFPFLAYQLCLNSWTYFILSFSRTFCSTI